MITVKMTDTEHHRYLPHGTDTGSRLPNLQATMPSSKARRVIIVKGGYCSNVSHLEKVKEKRRQHAKLEEPLQLYKYNMTSLVNISGSIGSQYHGRNDTLCRLGIQRSVANKLWNKVYEHTIACADKLMKSRRMLERSKCRQNRKRPRADPPRSMIEVNPSELLPWDSSLGGASRSRGSRYDASRCKLPLLFFCIARAVKTGQQAR